MTNTPVWAIADTTVDISDDVSMVFDPENERGCMATAYLHIVGHDSSGPDPYRDYPEVPVYRASGARIAVGDEVLHLSRATMEHLGMLHVLTAAEERAFQLAGDMT
jgi:hypothetical protein